METIDKHFSCVLMVALVLAVCFIIVQQFQLREVAHMFYMCQTTASMTEGLREQDAATAQAESPKRAEYVNYGFRWKNNIP